jgi:hypothetical protein
VAKKGSFSMAGKRRGVVNKDYIIGRKKSTTFFHARISRCGKGRVSDFLGHEVAEFFFTIAQGGGGHRVS